MLMWMVSTFASVALIVLILVDGFETMVLPRRVTRLYRPTRLFYRSTWMVWRLAAGTIQPGKRRQAFLSVFGPLSLLALLATWVSGLVVAFGLLHWSLGTRLNSSNTAADLPTDLHLPAPTLLTIRYAVVATAHRSRRFLAVS